MCDEKDRTLAQPQCFLLHDVPTHTTEPVTNNMVIVPHPPYSLNFPCDFALFLKLKTKLKG
jgi:hypothetical protein